LQETSHLRKKKDGNEKFLNNSLFFGRKLWSGKLGTGFLKNFLGKGCDHWLGNIPAIKSPIAKKMHLRNHSLPAT
jgi:hypothetical protein